MPLPVYNKNLIDLSELEKRNEAFREVFLKYQEYIRLCEEHSKLNLQEQLEQKSEIAARKNEWLEALHKFREDFPIKGTRFFDSTA